MRIRMTYILPLGYLVLFAIAPLLGHYGVLIMFLGFPLSVYVSEAVKNYYDPTYIAALVVAVQYALIGLGMDLVLHIKRGRNL